MRRLDNLTVSLEMVEVITLPLVAWLRAAFSIPAHQNVAKPHRS